MVGSTVTAGEWRSGRVSSHDDEAIRGDKRLGALRQLKGTWLNAEGFEGRMWNMIALPFGPPPQFPFQYRLLLNQGNERLRFSVGDLGVANRGLDQHDQHLAALMYLQEIDQIKAVDAAVGPTGAPVIPATLDVNDTPKGGTFKPDPNTKELETKKLDTVGIHRESGIFFRLGGQTGPCDDPNKPGPDLGRMASIPHGDTVLALSFDGNNQPVAGGPNFADPAVRAAFGPFPIGLGDPDVNQPYLSPYKAFADAPFKGDVTKPGFKGFDPTHPLDLLATALNPAKITVDSTTFLRFDTEMTSGIAVPGAISNIPFINCQASTTKVTAFFWIQKVLIEGQPRFLLQYAQRVLLEFLNRVDGQPGLIRWPHITINTLIRAPDEDAADVTAPDNQAPANKAAGA